MVGLVEEAGDALESGTCGALPSYPDVRGKESRYYRCADGE
jgi:hypothetical protein